MSIVMSALRRVGLYFGLVEPEPHERRSPGPEPIGKRMKRAAVPLIVGGILIGALDDSVWTGVRWVLVFSAVLVVIDVLDRRKRRRR